MMQGCQLLLSWKCDSSVEFVSRDQVVDQAALLIYPAIAFFTRCTVPLPHPTRAAVLRMPFPARRCICMAV
jgi:hypothetical protein